MYCCWYQLLGYQRPFQIENFFHTPHGFVVTQLRRAHCPRPSSLGLSAFIFSVTQHHLLSTS